MKITISTETNAVSALAQVCQKLAGEFSGREDMQFLAAMQQAMGAASRMSSDITLKNVSAPSVMRWLCH